MNPPIVDGHHDATGIAGLVQAVKGFVHAPLTGKGRARIETILAIVRVHHTIMVLRIGITRWRVDPNGPIPVELGDEKIGGQDVDSGTAWTAPLRPGPPN